MHTTEYDRSDGWVDVILSGPADEVICAAADRIRAAATRPIEQRPALLHVERREGRTVRIAFVEPTGTRQLGIFDHAA